MLRHLETAPLVCSTENKTVETSGASDQISETGIMQATRSISTAEVTLIVRLHYPQLHDSPNPYPLTRISFYLFGFALLIHTSQSRNLQ